MKHLLKLFPSIPQFLLTSLFFITTQAFALDPVYTSFIGNTAIGGYDPVAYFTQSKPVKGRGDFSYSYKGADWNFASQENLDAFKASPEKYAPQYGGYCAYAVSQGYTASTDPLAWTIVDDKLYLNYSKSVRQLWLREAKNNILKGDKNWPGLLNN